MERSIQPTSPLGAGPSRSPLELSECALWIEGPTWLTEDEESENDEFNNEQLQKECLEEMKAGDKEKWKVETSSSLLVTAEATGITNSYDYEV